MSGLASSWSIALRIGRRDVLRSRGRSALIATMVGTPVLLTVMLTSIVASNDISEREGLPDEIGSAEAVATYVGGTIQQTPDGAEFTALTEPSRRLETTSEQARALEKASGGSVDPVERGYSTTVVIDGRGYSSDWLSLDASRAATSGMFRVVSGRPPRADDEVLVSQQLADRGARIGSTVEVEGDKTLRVVGIGRNSTVVRGGDAQTMLVVPGALAALAALDGTTFLIDGRGPVGWDAVKKLNTAGFSVISREVLAHPPSNSDLYPELQTMSSAGDAATRAVLAIVVTAIVLQVVLLAGPAFAVGVRRQRRELALLAATGASPRQIRRVVLGQALVLGVLACVLAAALGTALSALVVRLGPSVVPRLAFGPFDMQWSYVAAAVLLGSIASMVAAYVPARQASKQQVAAVLAGRRGIVRSSRGWPVVGLALVGAGLATCFAFGTRVGGEFAVAASTIAIVVGAVLLTPIAIGAVAGAGSWLPLPLRLALRDTARQRARSAPAIAAVMASVAGITTLSIGAASDFEQSRRDYQYQQSVGRMTISASAATLDRAMAAASSASGGIDFTPLGSAGTESNYGQSRYVYAAASETYTGTSDAVVGDAAMARAWGVRLDAEQEQALTTGRAVVGDASAIRNGRVALDVSDDNGDSRTVSVPAVVGDLSTGSVPSGPEPTLGLVLLSPETMTSLDLPWEARRAISAADATTASGAVEDKVQQAVSGLDPLGGGAYVERGFQESFALPFLALFGFGALAVLIGTMTATGLALSDARPDFSTLAAVGAAPRTRRLVAGAQAVVLASLGTVLGIAVGFAPGIAVTWPLTSVSYVDNSSRTGSPIIDVPWLLLGAILVAVPVIAAMAAMAFTRSRLPVVRRLAQ